MEGSAVLAKRESSRHDDDCRPLSREANVAFVSEFLRNGQSHPAEPTKTEEKISVFWRVFGGTILSITALVVIQAYQTLNNGIHELRSDQSRLREVAADFVKKDELTTRTTSLWNRVQDLQNLNTSLGVANNKLSALETQLTAADRERKEMQASLGQLAAVRDRIALLDDSKRVGEQDHKELLTIAAAVQGLREKDALLEKQLRDSESERKDLTRELQSMKERLAKIEGSQQPGSGKTFR